jgi:Na+-translocating ferredoxin:NAD+ oxidoreductase subunit G
MNLSELKTRIPYHPVLLGVIGLIASGALAVANLNTKDAIQAAEQRDLEQSLKQVLPDGFADNDLLADTLMVKKEDGSTVKIYRAKLGKQFKAAVFEVSSRGYAGPVNALMGIDEKGTILGVRVIKHAETPGLGDKIELAKDKWILDFNGKSFSNTPLDKFGVKKDGGVFDQFAGATITPRAVVKAVREGMQFYDLHQKQIASGEQE